jgi:hypothetical protein
VLDTLVAAGVKRVYGLVGDSLARRTSKARAVVSFPPNGTLNPENRETLQHTARLTVKRYALGPIVRSIFSASTRFDSYLFI